MRSIIKLLPGTRSAHLGLHNLCLALGLASTALLSACNSGTASYNSSTTNAAANTVGVTISTLTSIPLSTTVAKGEYVIVEAQNTLNTALNLKAIQITRNGQQLSSAATASYVDNSQCLSLAAKAKCQLKILSPAPQNSAATLAGNSSYLLQLSYTDQTGQSFVASQVISETANLPNQAGFSYAANNLSVVANSSLSIPFRLEQNFNQVQVLLNEQAIPFSCNQAGYNANNLCSVLIHPDQLSQFSQNSLKFSGTSSNHSQVTTPSLLSFSTSSQANLVTSGLNQTINPDDGSSPQQIFIVNTGLSTATNITLTAANPLKITQSSSTPCGSTLGVGGSCSFYVNVSGLPSSGESNVVLTYVDGLYTQVVNFNVSYINPGYSPQLTLTPSGSFSNVNVSAGPNFYTVNITNSGNVALTNLQYNDINKQNSSMQSNAFGTTCASGQSLSINQSCSVILSYDPNAVQSGSVNFIPQATYLDPAGKNQTYANSKLNISYSAIAGTNFVAVGDFGVTLQSSAAGTSWSAKSVSPFTTNTEIANGIVDGGGTMLMVLNDGQAKYTTNSYGLFWQATGATNLGSNLSCSVIYDGTNFYTCGIAGAVAPTGCAASKGCVERIAKSNLSTSSWSGLQSNGNNAAPLSIAYYTNGTNAAYIVGDPKAGNGLFFSSANGSTWFSPSDGGALTAANNVLATAYNANSQEVSLWDAQKASASALISSVTGTIWTKNTSNSYGSNQTTAAVWANSLYVLAVGSNGIWSSNGTPNTPGTTYTLTNPAGTQINGLTYGNSTFLAVGNSGVNLTATNPIAANSWTNNSAINVAGSNPNLTSAYFDSSSSLFWATGASTLVHSTDGINWVSSGLASITKLGSNYLTTDYQGHIFSSSDLITWTLVYTSSQPLNAISCPSSSLCFAVGNNGTILKSTNGTTWNTLTSGTSNKLTAMVYQGNTLMVVGGSGANNSGTVLVSTDNTTFTLKTSSLNSKLLTGVSFLTNEYIAVGQTNAAGNGAILVSTDGGATWSAETSGTTQNLNAVSCASQIGCAAVGNSGVALYSGYGIGWISTTSNTTQNINAISYNGVFVAVGAGNYLAHLGNNSTAWTKETFPAGSSTTTGMNAVTSN